MKVMVVEENGTVSSLLGNSSFGLTNEVVLFGNITDNGQPVWAASFAEASASSYDLIIIDSALSGVDVISLCRQLKIEGGLVPILLLTSPGPRQSQSAIEAGVDDYLTKPFDTETLISRISFLSARQQRERLSAPSDHIPAEVTVLQQRERRLQKQLAREQLVAQITDTIRQTLNIDEILQAAVEQVRIFLQSDRVVVLKFQPNWRSRVEAESVGPSWDKILGISIQDACLGKIWIEQYPKGRMSVIYDVETASIDNWHRNLLKQFQVEANLVVPILQGEHLWGLLVAHQCSSPRQWTNDNTYLLKQVAAQMGIAIQQAELYQKIREQAALIDIATDAIFVRDLAGQITFWSQGATKLYGWRADEAIGQSARQLLQKRDEALLKEALTTTIKQGFWQGELSETTKGGKQLLVVSRWTFVPDEAGSPKFLMEVNTDITDKKQRETQYYQAQRLESLGQLAGGVAHDLGNVLTPILGVAQLLRLTLKNVDSSTQEQLDILERSAKRGANMVRQILTFAKGSPETETTVDIAALLQEVIDVARQGFSNSIEIYPKFSSPKMLDKNIDGLSREVVVDSTHLHQVFMNLCINARDAMPEGGSLTISLDNTFVAKSSANKDLKMVAGHYVVVTVADTGIGIAPDVIDRIFDPFFTTKAPDKGTGLGLATVIGIVKNAGGFLKVFSDMGKGTTIKVYLPQVNRSQEMATTSL